MPCKRLLAEQILPFHTPPLPESEKSDGVVRPGAMKTLLKKYGSNNKEHARYLEELERKAPEGTVSAPELANYLGIGVSTFDGRYWRQEFERIGVDPEQMGKLHNIRWFKVSPTVFKAIREGRA